MAGSDVRIAPLLGSVRLTAFYEVAGQDAEFLPECFCKMAEIGETDLAAGLFDADLPIDQ